MSAAADLEAQPRPGVCPLCHTPGLPLLSSGRWTDPDGHAYAVLYYRHDNCPAADPARTGKLLRRDDPEHFGPPPPRRRRLSIRRR